MGPVRPQRYFSLTRHDPRRLAHRRTDRSGAPVEEPPWLTPSPAHRYWVQHAERLRRTFHALTGRCLLDAALSPETAAEALFHAPFVALSHHAAPDPLLTYGNRKALELFELTWEALTALPSRCTAEAPNRAERARLLAEVIPFLNRFQTRTVRRTKGRLG